MDRSSRTVTEEPIGKCLLDYCSEEDPSPHIQYNGHFLTREQASQIRAKHGDFVEFYWTPGEGVFWYVVISLIIAVISYAIQALTAPTIRSLEEGPEESATYGFGGLRNTVRPGTRIPIVYGEHRVAGHLIQQFLKPSSTEASTTGELHTLIGLCSGEVEEISEVRVDQNPIELLGGNIEQHVREGADHQEGIPGFEELILTQTVAIELTQSGEPIVETFRSGDYIDNVRVVFNFPQGLLRQSNKGSLLEKSVTFRIEHALVDPETDTRGVWELNGKRVVSGKTRNSFDAFYFGIPLYRGRYYIRVIRETPDASSSQESSRSEITSIDGIVEEALTYPRTALLAVKQLPTAQISGRTPTYDCMVKGRKVRVYSTLSDYTVEWSDNPSWCLFEFLTNLHDGLGPFIGVGKVDIQSFIDWAEYCDELVAIGSGVPEKRYRLDYVADGSSSAIDTVKQICSIGQAMFLLRGNKWSVKIDRAEAPTQKFSMGRIVDGSFKVQHDGKVDKANFVIGQFLNRDLDFDNDSLQAEDPLLPADAEQIDATVNMAGATRITQVQRLLNYHVLTNRLIKRTVEFEASVESINVTAGDVFLLSHDVPGWGYSGILQSVDSTQTKLQLDRDVTLEEDKSYELTVVHSADDQVSIMVVSNSNFDVVSVAGDWRSDPVAGDHFSLGETSRSTVKMRAISVTKGTAPWRRSIRAREYDENVYGGDLTVLPAPSVTRIKDPFKIPDPVSRLRIAERRIVNEDGSLSAAIDVHFSLPVVPQARAEVYWRNVGDIGWESLGETSSGSFSISDNVESPGEEYEISVVTLSINGTRRHPDDGKRVTLTTTTSTRQPESISGFRADRTSGGLIFSWNALDPVTNFDLDYYELREGSSWEAAVLIGRTTNTIFETGVFVKGLKTFLIKAFNTAGNEAIIAKAVVFDVTGRIGENVILSRKEHTLGWTGDKVAFEVDAEDRLVLQATSESIPAPSGPGGNSLGSGVFSGGQGATTTIFGTYTTEVIEITTGEAVRTLFSVDILFETSDSTLFWEAAGVGDKEWDSEFGRERTWASTSSGKASFRLEMRFSSDTASDADFGEWQERPQNVEILAKHAQARVTVTLIDTSITARIAELTIIADVPDIVESGEETSSDSAEVTVEFAKTFNATPSLGTTILSAVAGDRISLTELDKDGFKLSVLNDEDDGNRQDGRIVEWIAAGF